MIASDILTPTGRKLRPVEKGNDMGHEMPLPIDQIGSLIRTICGQKVILDFDLARIFGVPTFRFNEAVKRNRARFPDDFLF